MYSMLSMLYKSNTKEVMYMSTTIEKLAKLDKITTFAQLAKISTIDEITQAYRTYLHSKLYHAARNKRISRLAKLAIAAGLDK